MTGLPRAKDVTRPQSVFSVVLIQGIERLTTSLRRGDPFCGDSLNDMIVLRNRLDAFRLALEERVRLQGMSELFEDFEE